MPEVNVIERTEYPLTAHSLIEKLRECGLRSGQTVLAHMAMSQLGWIAGGAEAVLIAFLDVLGPQGTLMMPTHTTNNTDPAEWQNPPVPPQWWQLIRDHMPAYQPATTPTYGMGVVPELFRTWPGVIRSAHPVTSFAARGPNAEYLIFNHALADDVAERSPLGRLYDLDGYVLLLGVPHWNNTSLHLAEARANYPGKRNLRSGTAMLVEGQRQWVEYETLETYTDDFGEIGQAFDTAYQLPIQRINQAEVRFFKQRTLVDFATAWIEKHRNLTPDEGTNP